MTSEKDKIVLDKKLSQLDVWSLSLGCIIGWGAFVMPGDVFLPKAGPLGTAVAMSLASIVMIIISFNYSCMIKRHSKIGGEYIYAKESFGKRHAFFCSWFLGLSYLSIIPLNATALALIGRNLFGEIFKCGFHYSVVGYDVYGGEILLALLALALFARLSVRGVKLVGVFQTTLTFAIVLGIIIMSIQSLFSPLATLENLTPVIPPHKTFVSAVLSVFVVAPWAFVGFDTIPQAVEEFKFSAMKSKFLMIGSVVFGGLVYILLNTITASVIPVGYGTWVDYTTESHHLNGIMSLPTFYAVYSLFGRFGCMLIGIVVLSAVLSGIMGFYMATSRLFLSMAREKVLPAWFGKLNPKYHTPSNSIVFIMLISMIAPFLGRTVLGWIVDMSSLGAAIGFGYTSAAALKYGMNNKLYGTIVTGIIGLGFSLLFMFFLLVPIKGLSCSLNVEAYACLLGWVLLGILFYYFAEKRSASLTKTHQR